MLSFKAIFVLVAVLSPSVLAAHGPLARLHHGKRFEFGSIIQDPTSGGPSATESFGFPDRPTPTASLTPPSFPPLPSSTRSAKPIPGDSPPVNASTILATPSPSTRFIPSPIATPSTTPLDSVTPTPATPTIMIPVTSIPQTVTSTVSVIGVATPAPTIALAAGGSLLESMGLAPALGFILKLKRSLIQPHFGSSASFSEDHVGYVGVASA